MREIQRNTDADLSIFEDTIFTFYLCKYCEVLGKEALLSVYEKIQYSTKRRIIEYILTKELELGVAESSWKTCLFYLKNKEVISDEQYKKQFENSNLQP